jgi:hypothetical protein
MKQLNNRFYHRTFSSFSKYLIWDKLVNKGRELMADVQVNQFNVVVKFK